MTWLLDSDGKAYPTKHIMHIERHLDHILSHSRVTWVLTLALELELHDFMIALLPHDVLVSIICKFNEV